MKEGNENRLRTLEQSGMRLLGKGKM